VHSTLAGSSPLHTPVHSYCRPWQVATHVVLVIVVVFSEMTTSWAGQPILRPVSSWTLWHPQSTHATAANRTSLRIDEFSPLEGCGLAPRTILFCADSQGSAPHPLTVP